jgi:hypothetical protein
VQLSIRCGHRIRDRSIAGNGKEQRYFASDFDQLSEFLPNREAPIFNERFRVTRFASELTVLRYRSVHQVVGGQ